LKKTNVKLGSCAIGALKTAGFRWASLGGIFFFAKKKKKEGSSTAVGATHW